MDRLKEIWFVDWWLKTQNMAAKLLVIQAVGAKIAAVVAIVCLIYIGGWVIDTAVQIVPFRIWSDQMVTRNLTIWHAAAVALLVGSIIVMSKCNV